MPRPNSIAADVFLKLTAKPLWAANGFVMEKGKFMIGGMALPPDGMHDKVRWEGDDGISFSVDYPLPNPGAAEVYWFWPGAEQSSFRINIDLASCRHSGDAYRFCLRFGEAELTGDERVRNTFLVPKSLQALENYPAQQSLERVQRYDTISSVALKGLSDALRIKGIAKRHHKGVEKAAILDWGCGHGRVLRFLPQVGCRGRLHGIDIDPHNIAWAQKHLDMAEFKVGPLFPPLPYADKSFDMLYGISVMTHLTSEVQETWLAELRRVLKPGGLALLTFAGDSSVAFASRYLTDAWVVSYLADGHAADLPDQSLVGIVENGGDYYRNVKQNLSIARARCERYFQAIETLECAFGYQDLIVLRRDT